MTKTLSFHSIFFAFHLDEGAKLFICYVVKAFMILNVEEKRVNMTFMMMVHSPAVTLRWG